MAYTFNNVKFLSEILKIWIALWYLKNISTILKYAKHILVTSIGGPSLSKSMKQVFSKNIALFIQKYPELGWFCTRKIPVYLIETDTNRLNCNKKNCWHLNKFPIRPNKSTTIKAVMVTRGILDIAPAFVNQIYNIRFNK